MKKNKYLFVCCMLLAISLASGIFTRAYMRFEERGTRQDTLHVATSFYPVYIAALNVAGDSPGIVLENLSEPQTGCMHDYQLTPQDMILLSDADLFLVNGGGIENFLVQVGEAYPDLAISEVSQGIELLEEQEKDEHTHAAKNAHVWMDTRLYAEMVQNIAAILGTSDPEHKDLYQENADFYCKKIEKLTVQLAKLREQTRGKPAVIFHEAYAYVVQELGMREQYCLNLDEERQVSAREAADVMEEITERQVSVVFAEELYGRDMGTAVEAETEARVCYLDTLVRGDYQPDSYLTAVQKNIDALQALLEEQGMIETQDK